MSKKVQNGRGSSECGSLRLARAEVLRHALSDKSSQSQSHSREREEREQVYQAIRLPLGHKITDASVEAAGIKNTKTNNGNSHDTPIAVYRPESVLWLSWASDSSWCNSVVGKTCRSS
jgi:hypothetical protein